jgi:hypothetical protein
MVYSKMLYMKRSERRHRVTFRVAGELAARLRKLPNQTVFVEEAIREALGQTCPACRGRGRVPTALRVSDFREAELPRIGRSLALQLQQVVRMGRRMCATDLRLADTGEAGLAFQLARREELLFSGRIRNAVVFDH